MLIKKAVGSYWGPHPKALKWAIQGIIIPSLSFGAIVWSKVCEHDDIMKRLTRLNRFMALSLMPVRKSTPTMALEVILGLKPLDIRIEEIALKAFLRVLHKDSIKWGGVFKKDKGHLMRGKKMLASLGINTCDYDVTNSLNLNKKYSIDLDSFKKGTPDKNPTLKCFTDGSKISNQSGFGFAITEGNWVMAQEDGKLSPNNTVFQAEIMAILKCAKALEMFESTRAVIYSDSQAALAALNSHKIKHKSVKDCADALNDISITKHVTLKYIKAHVGYSGNEYADFLAKKGTVNTENNVVVAPPISWAKQLIESYSLRKWASRWESTTDCRQSKIWFSKNNKRVSNFFISLGRLELGMVTQFLTGHNRLNYHEFVIDQNKDPWCRFCQEDFESSWHFIADCPQFWGKRREIFKVDFLDENPEWVPEQIIKFIRRINFNYLNERGENSPSQ